MHHERVRQCGDILDIKLDEYINTHKEWHKKGLLCPHEGDARARAKMVMIMEDVEEAHDMLHIAMARAGYDMKDSMKADNTESVSLRTTRRP